MGTIAEPEPNASGEPGVPPSALADAARLPDDEASMQLPVEMRVEEMLRRRSSGDTVGAFVLADSVIRDRPEHGLARICLLECVGELRFGSSNEVPLPLFSSKELARVSLQPRVAFLLSRVDGTRSIGSLVEASELPRGQTLRWLTEFVRRRLIYFMRPSGGAEDHLTPWPDAPWRSEAHR